MRILLDHCVPRQLALEYADHEVVTTSEMGWAALKNGKLLEKAAAHFDVVLTVDRNIKSQQNINTLPIAIVVMLVQANTAPQLAACTSAVRAALKELVPCTLIEVRPAK